MISSGTPPVKSPGKTTPLQRAYADRCAYWERQAGPSCTWQRGNDGRTLMVGGYGTIIRVRHDALEIVPGIASASDFARRSSMRIDRGVHGVHQILVFQESRGCLTLDAIRWLEEQGISLTIIDYRGRMIGQWMPPRAPLAEVHAGQWQLWHDESRRLCVARDVVRAKMLAQVRTLEDLASHLPEPDAVRDYAARLLAWTAWFELPDSPPLRTVNRLMLVEARAARGYWQALADMHLRYAPPAYARGLPAHWLRVGERHSPLRAMRTAQDAVTPGQSMINYGYALLESRIRLALHQHGLNPAIPVLHALRDGRDSLVYDMMEPFRPRVDACLLSWVVEHQPWAPGDFLTAKDGSIRINPALVRVVARHLLQQLTSWQSEIDAWCDRLTDLVSELVSEGGDSMRPSEGRRQQPEGRREHPQQQHAERRQHPQQHPEGRSQQHQQEQPQRQPVYCRNCGQRIPPEKLAKSGYRRGMKSCCKRCDIEYRTRTGFYLAMSKLGWNAQRAMKQQTGVYPGADKRRAALANARSKRWTGRAGHSPDTASAKESGS